MMALDAKSEDHQSHWGSFSGYDDKVLAQSISGQCLLYANVCLFLLQQSKE